MTEAPMLRGKTALVTGSTSGIGLGIARALAVAGADVIVNGFGDVETARSLIGKAGGRVSYHAADLGKADEVAALMAYAEAEHGGVDVLVNNGGIQHLAAIEDFPTERWDAIIAINLTAAFHTTRLALPTMRKRDWGRIINIGSVHSHIGSVHKAAYVAAKHGLLGLTKVTALETARTGVTCNAVSPGWVETALVQRQVEARAVRDGVDEARARDALISEKQPSGAFVSVEQLAAVAVFLCSPAADQVRGAAWSIDGCWTVQ